MADTNATTVKDAYDDLAHYHALTEAEFGNLHTWEGHDRMMVWGAAFHRTANRIKALTGTDPRDQYVT